MKLEWYQIIVKLLTKINIMNNVDRFFKVYVIFL